MKQSARRGAASDQTRCGRGDTKLPSLTCRVFLVAHLRKSRLIYIHTPTLGQILALFYPQAYRARFVGAENRVGGLHGQGLRAERAFRGEVQGVRFVPRQDNKHRTRTHSPVSTWRVRVSVSIIQNLVLEGLLSLRGRVLLLTQVSRSAINGRGQQRATGWTMGARTEHSNKNYTVDTRAAGATENPLAGNVLN